MELIARPDWGGFIPISRLEYNSYMGGLARVSTTLSPASPSEGQKHFHIPDHLGSVRVSLDTFGNLTQLDYEPFGTVASVTQMGTQIPRQTFIDKERDAENGLGDFGVRKYETETGRFLSVDALWEKGRGQSPYSYGAVNPITNVDPSGLDPNRAQAGNARDIIALVRSYEAENPDLSSQEVLRLMRDRFEHGEENKGARYVYTTAYRWVDFVHFFVSAEMATSLGSELTQILGVGNEWWQALKGDESGFAPEDVQSNMAGAVFGDDVFNPSARDGDGNPIPLSVQLAHYLSVIGATEKEHAPDYAELPADDAAARKKVRDD